MVFFAHAFEHEPTVDQQIDAGVIVDPHLRLGMDAVTSEKEARHGLGPGLGPGVDHGHEALSRASRRQEA